MDVAGEELAGEEVVEGEAVGGVVEEEESEHLVHFGIGVEEVVGESSLLLSGVEWVAGERTWVVEEREGFAGPGAVGVGV